MADDDVAVAALAAEDGSAADARAGKSVAGALVLADRVGAKIAERAALDVDAVIAYKSPMGSALGGVSAARSLVGGVYPCAEIDMGASAPRLSIEVALVWPSALTAVCRELRTRLTDELERLTGVRPVAVDVEVAHLVPRAEVRELGAGMIELPGVGAGDEADDEGVDP